MASAIGFSSGLSRTVTRSAPRFPQFISLAAPSCQCRPFSQSLAPRAKGIAQTVTMRPPESPSTRSRTRDIPRESLPQDIGLLPGTFIRPLWRDMPSIFHQPRERLRMEWLSLKMWAQNLMGVLAYSKYFNKGLPLRFRERRKVARELHQKMYTAFAAGDVHTLRKICCTGLANSLSARIAKRPSNERVTWSLDKYIRSPSTFFTGVRVVSDRATQIPEMPKSGIRQVVVRITSRQSTGTVPVTLKRGSKEAEPTGPPKVKEQDCTEYIVLQRIMWMGEEEEWRIWGHATPTKVEELDNPWFAPGLTLSERLKLMTETLGKKW
ncbi:hypothetical protein T310_7543 [Rasamsonia emersonii CBS 393.64]|uniref:Tim44-like domain-containing protein n=1 Tax=Rasamsonia emersonii (strain ATCC 16479 / CBS 393.64 / IMI 116815) TaxID=1408163 RepID=A0A0F4YKV6_RASE3|nr:hypothetical protein T310_7543 [Rasamsonia emersonii CBS 393.64]KKA18506.1 hypothetical protein T310_7543 [Rasamsonia emersonii CBS 393.64]